MKRTNHLFVLLVLLIVPMLISCAWLLGTETAVPPVATEVQNIPAATSAATEAPVATSEATNAPVATTLSSGDAATATAFANCYHPEQITASMIGQSVCVRGVIQNLSQGSAATRYTFSDQPNTFFLYDQVHEVIDPNTGKTLGPGTCVEVHGKIENISGVPYINIEDLLVGKTYQGFYFYRDPASCTW